MAPGLIRFTRIPLGPFHGGAPDQRDQRGFRGPVSGLVGVDQAGEKRGVENDRLAVAHARQGAPKDPVRAKRVDGEHAVEDVIACLLDGDELRQLTRVAGPGCRAPKALGGGVHHPGDLIGPREIRGDEFGDLPGDLGA